MERTACLKPAPAIRRPTRRQDKPLLFARNGPAVVAVHTPVVTEGKTLYGPDTRGLVMAREESFDIDDAFDLEVAERLMASRRVMKILFLAAHHAYYRNFESAIVALAERGHPCISPRTSRKSMGGQALVERLSSTLSGRDPRVRAVARRRALVPAGAQAAERVGLRSVS